MSRPDFGIVLCAGLGTRLSPLTDTLPKPLLSFLDQPIVRYMVDALLDHDVDTLGFNAHAHADRLQQWVSEFTPRTERRLAPRLSVRREPVLAGTGGGARGVWEHMGRPAGTCLVVNGDIVCDLPVTTLMQVHRRTGAAVTMMTLPPIPGEVPLWVDESRHFIVRVPGERDEVWSANHRSGTGAPVSFGGVYVMDATVLGSLPEGKSCLVRNGVAPLLQAGATIASCPFPGFWADLGTASRFLSATEQILERPELLQLAGLPVRSNHVWQRETRRVHPTARLEGPVLVAAGATVNAGAVVGPGAVIGAGCVVEEGAVVRHAVLMNGAHARGVVERQVCSGAAALRSV